jgi:hypothetical protein
MPTLWDNRQHAEELIMRMKTANKSFENVEKFEYLEMKEIKILFIKK